MLADLAGPVRTGHRDPARPDRRRRVAAFASSLLPLDDRLLRRVIAAAEGNPLLAVESARVLSPRAAPGRRRTCAPPYGPPPAAPGAGADAVELLAVAGRPLTRRSSAASAAELARGRGGGQRRRAARPPGRPVRFRHELLREAVYADLPTPRRCTTGSRPPSTDRAAPRSPTT